MGNLEKKPMGMVVDNSHIIPMVVDNSHIIPMMASYDQITHKKVEDDGTRAKFLALFTPKFLGHDINSYG